MLRCSGCGELVSEYAARCADCGHGVDDAVENRDRQPSPPVESDLAYHERDVWLEVPELAVPAWDIGLEQKPAANDASRSRAARNRSRSAVLMAAILLLVTASAVASTRSTGTSLASGLKSLDGRIVAESAAGQIVRVDPSSGTNVSYTLSGPPGQLGRVASSPDGTAWLDSAGEALRFSGSTIVLTPTAIGVQLSEGSSLAPSEAFADKGQAVVVLNRTAFRAPEAEVVTIGDGIKSDLGAVDSAGGDLQTLGAFVSTPSGFHIHGSSTPDSDVELREASSPPTVLATAGQLNTDVGWLPTTPIELKVYPSPTGEAVAVVLTPLNPVSGDTPMVVLDRKGELLAVLGDWGGPMYGTDPVWSPGGHEIAYPTYTTGGAALAIATETGSVETLTAPVSGIAFGACVWAPSSNGTVCQAREANGEVWLYTTLSAKRLLSGPGRGTPLAWIASSL